MRFLRTVVLGVLGCLATAGVAPADHNRWFEYDDWSIDLKSESWYLDASLQFPRGAHFFVVEPGILDPNDRLRFAWLRPFSLSPPPEAVTVSDGWEYASLRSDFDARVRITEMTGDGESEWFNASGVARIEWYRPPGGYWWVNWLSEIGVRDWDRELNLGTTRLTFSPVMESDSGSGQFLNFQVTAAETPEPGTLVLGGLGLLVAGLARRWRG